MESSTESKQTAVAALREKQGKSRADLCAAFTVTENTVRRWERGDGLTVEVLAKLADYFGVSTDVVLGRKTPA